MADDEDQKRPWREQYQTVGRTMVPLWFAVTGIALGVGGVIRDQPIAGACGAVAGVTVGWLQQQRASVYRRHNIALRKRLKKVRVEAQEHAEQLEQQVSRLQSEVLEQKMMRMLMNPNAETASELTGEIPAVRAPIVRNTHAPAPDWAPAKAAVVPEPAVPEPAVPDHVAETVAEPEPSVEPASATAEQEESAAPAAKADTATPAPAEATGESEDHRPEVGDEKPAEVTAEEADAADNDDADDDDAHDDDETPKRRGAQIIDLPAKLKAKAKRQAAQAG